MLPKLLAVTSIFITTFKPITYGITTPLFICQGYIYASDINEDIDIHFEYIGVADKNETYTFKVFEENVLTMSKKVNGSEIVSNKLSYTLKYDNPFKTYNSSKNISITITSNEDKDSVYSKNIVIYSIDNNTYINSSGQAISYSLNPTKVVFTLNEKKSKSTTQYFTERVVVNGPNIIENEYSRYIDLSDFYLFIDTIDEYEKEEIAFATLRLYDYDFDNDFYRQSPTSVDIEFLLENQDNYYYIINENRFYQDKYSGLIYENYNDYCSDILHPFFIPTQCITMPNGLMYSLIFSNIGIHQNTYIIQGKIYIKENLIGDNNSKFYYELIDTPLIDVNYEK